MEGVSFASSATMKAPAVSFAVAWTDVEQIWYGAVEGGELNGLVRCAIFTRADRVIRRDVDGLYVLDGAHPNAGGGILLVQRSVITDSLYQGRGSLSLLPTR